MQRLKQKCRSNARCWKWLGSIWLYNTDIRERFVFVSCIQVLSFPLSAGHQFLSCEFKALTIDRHHYRAYMTEITH